MLHQALLLVNTQIQLNLLQLQHLEMHSDFGDLAHIRTRGDGAGFSSPTRAVCALGSDQDPVNTTLNLFK